MPRKRKKEEVLGQHFKWLMGMRKGVYYADGRSNKPSVGRHSLGTRSRAEALQALQQLDLVKAVEFGLEDGRAVANQAPQVLELNAGWQAYRAYVQRPRIVGGAKPVTAKRYRPVFEKFIAFAQAEGITAWNHVTRRLLEAYAAHLDDAGYSPRSEYLELTTIKQAGKWFVKEGHLPTSWLFELPLEKPRGTDTYCWRPDELRAMVAHCRQRQDLQFLAAVIVALACTGLRISELAGLRWSDIDSDNNLIRLTDESAQAPRRDRRALRSTKSGRSRSFPIHPDLQGVLEALPQSADGLVFHGPRGGRLKPDTVRRVLIRDVIALLAEQFATAVGGIGFKDGRLHSFRHYFCSTCANSNVPQQVVMRWLGHADSAMVEHYYHLHDDEAQRQMMRLNFVGEAGGGGAAGDDSRCRRR
jgi:integrase